MPSSKNLIQDRRMKTTNDLWDDLGSIPEDELLHVVTKLFAIYEAEMVRDPASQEAKNFFRNLENAISQTLACNSNRR